MTTADKRIFYSKIGGVFVGKNIQSGYQKNYMITILMSFQESFQITISKQVPVMNEVVLIHPNTEFKITASPSDSTVFVHIDPYSDIGLRIQTANKVEPLPRHLFMEPLNKLLQWVNEAGNENKKIKKQNLETVETFIREIACCLPLELLRKNEIDKRVLRCMQIINQYETINLSDLARKLSLSLSRLSHLFKEETNITLRQYIQHHKLIKSIYGLHQNLNFTDAAYYGGFSDQSHFIRVFKKMLGIRPSKTNE